MTENYDSSLDTFNHIRDVQEKLLRFGVELSERGINHDDSKLQEPEKAFFDKYTPKLAGCTYGSDEYKYYLQALELALIHHYQVNSHHPEHYNKYICNGCFKEFSLQPDKCNICGYAEFQKEPDISQMNLFDIVEMFCDWQAATQRHANGDIKRSIEINTDRFKLSSQLASILLNTVIYLDG